MKCPHCQGDLPSQECPQCGKRIPELGTFCCYCGSSVEDLKGTPPDVGADEDSDNDKSDFSNRVLCSDGACIGVINEQGVCSECGKPYAGEAE